MPGRWAAVLELTTPTRAKSSSGGGVLGTLITTSWTTTMTPGWWWRGTGGFTSPQQPRLEKIRLSGRWLTVTGSARRSSERRWVWAPVTATRAGRPTDRCEKKVSTSELKSPVQVWSALRTRATAVPGWPPAGPALPSPRTASSTSSASAGPGSSCLQPRFLRISTISTFYCNQLYSKLSLCFLIWLFLVITLML